MYNETAFVTIEAAEALLAKTLVKLNSSGELAYADIGDAPIGQVFRAAAADGDSAVIRCHGVWEGIASEAIDIGDLVYTANDGKLSDTNNGCGAIGQALTASSGDGVAFRFIPLLMGNGGAGFYSTLATSEPATVGALWTNALAVTVSNGP